MNTAPQNTPTTDDIKSQFPYTTLDRIIGEPNYETINKLETKTIRNASTIELTLPPPHNNCSGLVEMPQMYLIRTGHNFPRPLYPGDTPTFPPGANVAQRSQIQQTYNARLRNYYIVQRTENILKTMLE